MKKYYGTILFVCLVIFGPVSSLAQDNSGEAAGKPNKNSISISISQSYISQGIQNGNRKWLIEPSFMLDYNYLISEKWLAGIHSDIILQTFEVEEWDGSDVIKRSYPFCMVGVIGFKPVEFLTLMLGGGIEIADEGNFGVVRIGVEPSIKISEKWEMPFSLNYDLKIYAYDTWSLGIGIARLF